jgi:hypothetical protein
MISKYPHTATISYLSAGTTNTYGVWTPGTVNTIALTDCDIQPASGQYAVGEGGAVLNYNWDVFTPLFSGSSSVPKDAKLTFSSADHIIVQLFNYQTHVEIKCRD